MRILHGNNIELLKSLPDNSIDAVVTDPPYGLGKEPIAEQLMKDWIEKGYHEVKGGGFMGKEWDAFVPQPIFWKEVFRVVKHGGHVVSFFGTRTYDWGVMAMRFAGFEIRDCIQWLYGSGFPKSHNISKAIDKMYGAERDILGVYDPRSKFDNSNRENRSIGGQQVAPSNTSKLNITTPKTEQAKEWDGWGSALKPANEPIVLARKPLEKGLSIADNVLKYGTGGINIDGCRVGTEERNYKGSGSSPNKINNHGKGDTGIGMLDGSGKDLEFNVSGRFPANVILTHHPDCECVGTKKVKGQIDKPTNRTQKGNTWDDNNSGLRKSMPKNSGGFGDVDGNETIEDWSCHDDCPIKILDEQSGVLKSGAMNSIAKGGQYNVYSKMNERRVVSPPSVGGASRFFYVAKASQSERNKGLDDFEKQPLAFSNQAKAELARGNTEFADDTKMHNKVQFRANNHPTVKPIKLMQYLARLITPPNGVVLDPFMGSGTTGIACKLEGFDFVGMEQDENYHKIAISRIENYLEQDEKIVIKVTTETEITEPKKTIIQSQLF